jgi:hypothetical protein
MVGGRCGNVGKAQKISFEATKVPKKIMGARNIHFLVGEN